MPNTINIYEPRNMMAVVERREKPTTFLRDTFFTRREMSTTDKVDIDIVKGNRNVAPFVHKVKGGKVASVKVVKHGETAMLVGAAEKKLAKQIVANNGTEGVNAVTGASNSSKGIIAAVDKALAKAK